LSPSPLEEELDRLLQPRNGHFRFESGHHGDLWLELELLYLHPSEVRSLAAELSRRLRGFELDGVCGPLVEGALVALQVASELGVELSYAERLPHADRGGLFPVEYRIPGALRRRVRGRRVAIVNDVISAGSAVRGTLADLRACGAEPVAIGAFLVLGPAAGELAAAEGLALEAIASRPNNLWEPGDCPLCASGVPLEDLAG
jgi:orotate phosphoribosyltransferase